MRSFKQFVILHSEADAVSADKLESTVLKCYNLALMSNDAAQQTTPDAASSGTPLRTALDKLLALQAIDTQRDKLVRARKQLDPGVEQQKQAVAASDNAKTVASQLAEDSGGAERRRAGAAGYRSQIQALRGSDALRENDQSPRHRQYRARS